MRDDMRDIVSAWCRRWDIRSASAFGSVVRGDMTDDSDIDLFIVEGNTHRDRDSVVARREDIERLLGRPVDIGYRAWFERSPDYDPARLGEVVTLYDAGVPWSGPWRPRRRLRLGAMLSAVIGAVTFGLFRRCAGCRRRSVTLDRLGDRVAGAIRRRRRGCCGRSMDTT